MQDLIGEAKHLEMHFQPHFRGRRMIFCSMEETFRNAFLDSNEPQDNDQSHHVDADDNDEDEVTPDGSVRGGSSHGANQHNVIFFSGYFPSPEDRTLIRPFGYDMFWLLVSVFKISQVIKLSIV